jgi:hypothetical protein
MARLSRLTWLLALCAFALFFVNDARAQDVRGYVSGFQWHNSLNTAIKFNTAYEAGASALALSQAAKQASYCTPGGHGTISYNTYAVTQNAGTANPRARASWYEVCGPLNNLTGSDLSRSACTPGTNCPTPPIDCASAANSRFGAIANNQVATFSMPDTGCFGGCAAFKKSWKVVKADGTTADAVSTRNRNGNGTYNYLTKYQYTGLACTVEPVRNETPVSTPTGPGGTGTDKFAEAPSGEGCGWVNGKYGCYKSLQPDKCWVNSDGSRICAQSAPTPPKPLNSAGTAAATPNDSFDVCTGANSCQSYEYFNTATNSAAGQPSSNTGDTSNEGPGTGTVGTGPGDGSGGDGTGAGGGTSGGATWCDVPPTCDGDPVACAQLVQQWRTMCPEETTEAEALDAMGATEGEKDGTALFSSPVDISGTWSSDGPVTAGSCPAPLGVSVMGQSISLDIWKGGCEMALLFAPIVMSIAWLLTGLMLIKGTW